LPWIEGLCPAFPVFLCPKASVCIENRYGYSSSMQLAAPPELKMKIKQALFRRRRYYSIARASMWYVNSIQFFTAMDGTTKKLLRNSPQGQDPTHGHPTGSKTYGSS